MFAVICIPDFALQSVLRNEPELFLKAVALLDERETKALVFQMTQLARAAGVCEGLTSTQALARCSNLLVKTRSFSSEKTAGEILLQTAYNFSPRIEATADGVCTLDLQGLNVLPTSCRQNNDPDSADRMSGARWAQKIITALAQFHLRALIGIARTPNLAWHASRFAQPILIVENSTDFIAALPIQSLNPSPEIFGILQRWGIRNVSEFTALGRDKIAERLGTDALELFDRASTETIHPLNLVTPSEQFSETMDFEVEIESLQPLLFVLRRFVEQLTRRIEMRHCVVAELELQLSLSSGEKYKSVLKVPSPTANVEILFRMLQTHLENVRTDSAIVALELSAKPCRAEHFQFGLFESSLRDPNQFAETLARLSALCGSENIGSPVLENSFRPDAFKMEPPIFEATSTPRNFAHEPHQGLILRRFRPPFHADVELKNGVPVFISSLKLNSPIEHFSGPFRSSGNWWEKEKIWNRDEWDICAKDGGLYRIFRENQNWFVEGIYD